MSMTDFLKEKMCPVGVILGFGDRGYILGID